MEALEIKSAIEHFLKEMVMGHGTSSEFNDVAWLKEMVKHHKMAIKMSKEAESDSKREEIKKLAKDIINAQTEEIKKMEGWVKNWEEKKM